ncbi:hypothetical protein DSO57_1034551 [Entomophthora muscae]|uniref:Uncharacterized protein n=1 Tax=Entomophthora muscae TaxID=34485 RepID=A0ACC2U9L3_9FUNG|nr:hypothetical protein DSO57_1034551 [Entomophthora muscae]
MLGTVAEALAMGVVALVPLIFVVGLFIKCFLIFLDRRGRQLRSPSPYMDDDSVGRDGFRSGGRLRYRDASPDSFDRGFNDFGRHRRNLAPDYFVSNYDFDNPVNSSLNDPIHHPDFPGRPELADPLELTEMVSIDYYADYLRLSEPNGRHSDNSIQNRYKKYQDVFNSRLVGAFFADHHSEPWFREKYFPASVAKRIQALKPIRAEAYDKFITDLKEGVYDNICYDAPKREFQPKADESNKAKLEEEAGEENREPGEHMEDSEEEKEASNCDEFHALFIKSVPPSISQEQLKEVCSKAEGFKHLILGEPNPLKRFHRLAWVLFDPSIDINKALETLDKTMIDEFTLFLGLHNIRNPPRMANEISNTARRLNIDSHHAQKLARLFEKELGDEYSATEHLDDRLVVIFRKNRADNQGEPNDDIWEIKKTLDLYLCYLRKVFFFCYYCCLTCDGNVELQRKCRDNHLRLTPRSSLNRAGEAWAESLDSRVERRLMSDNDPDLELLGGKDLEKVIDDTVAKLVEEVGETKFRCSACNKLFKGAEFVKKHLKTKHPETYNDAAEEVQFLNNYVRDPNRIMPASPNPPGPLPALLGGPPPMGGYPMYNPVAYPFHPSMNPHIGLPFPPAPPIRMGFPDSDAFVPFPHDMGPTNPGFRGAPPSRPPGPLDPRQLKSYIDLDAPAEGETEISYN